MLVDKQMAIGVKIGRRPYDNSDVVAADITAPVLILNSAEILRSFKV